MNNQWCDRCGRHASQHLPGKFEVVIELDGRIFAVACDQANPYFTPYGAGRLVDPRTPLTEKQ